MRRKLLVLFIIILGAVLFVSPAFGVDSVIRNNTGDLEISTKTTDGGAVHIKSK